jgi:hypothetical protein
MVLENHGILTGYCHHWDVTLVDLPWLPGVLDLLLRLYVLRVPGLISDICLEQSQTVER